MSRKVAYVGVDIGKDGGIAGIIPHHDKVLLHPMPVIGMKGKGTRSYNLQKISDVVASIVADYEVRGAVIEDATFQPKWSKKTWGDQYGCLYAFMAFFTVYSIPYKVVKARIWQKKVFESMQKQDTKTMAELFCFRRFPKTDFILPGRMKSHMGIIDAACIAEYARLTL
jgi:hypothetical protein